FDHKDIHKKIRIKQKELARRFNIPLLPSDREPGYIGQAALFEILQNARCDFSLYIEDYHNKQIKMWEEGFGLLHILGTLYEVRKYFECPPLDLVRHILEPLNPNTITILWDQNWMHRVLTNAQAMKPYLPYDEMSHTVLKNLVRVQDSRGLTISQVVNWTDLSRKQANRLFDTMTTCGLIHSYVPVMKNLNLSYKVEKNTSPSSEMCEQETLCTSLDDGNDYFLRVSYIHSKNAGKQDINISGLVCNIENYIVEEREWKVPRDSPDVNDILELSKLYHNSDMTISINNRKITRRDLFYVALLQSMPMEVYRKKLDECILRISKGCKIPRKEVELGLRNVLRKNLVRSQYSIIPSHDRHFLFIHFDDEQRKTLDMLGRILPRVPVAYLHSNHSFDYGLVGVVFPTYLACDAREVIQSAVAKSEVNTEVFSLKSFKRGGTANLLRIIEGL
ncbi:MAG: hypothetical protein ACXAEF_14555, partial [Candidatus Thorarchaeota archaeon]